MKQFNFRIPEAHKEAIAIAANNRGGSISEYMCFQATFARIEAATTPYTAGVVQLIFTAVLDRIQELNNSPKLTKEEGDELAGLLEWRDFFFDPLVYYDPPDAEHYRTRVYATMRGIPDSIRARVYDIKNFIESFGRLDESPEWNG